MAAKRFYVISTGFLEHDLGVLLAGKSGPVLSPIPAYLIETDDGWILYDCGPDPNVAIDPQSCWKGLLKIFQPKVKPSDHIVARLDEIGLKPDDINYVVQSHLHFDHAGGLRNFPESKIVVHRDEYRFAHNPDPYLKGGYLKSDFNYPDLNWEFIDGDQVLVPGVTIVLTHGHSPGHLSIIIDLQNQGPIILAGDCIQLKANAERMILSGTCWNQALAYQGILRLKTLISVTKGELWPNHDIQFWNGLKKLPDFYD